MINWDRKTKQKQNKKRIQIQKNLPPSTKKMPKLTQGAILGITLGVVGTLLIVSCILMYLYLPQGYLLHTYSLQALSKAPLNFLYMQFNAGRMGNVLIQYANMRLIAEDAGKNWHMIPTVPNFSLLTRSGKGSEDPLDSPIDWSVVPDPCRTTQKMTFAILGQYKERVRAWYMPTVQAAECTSRPPAEWAIHLRMGDVWQGINEMNSYGHTPIPAHAYSEMLPPSARSVIVVSDMSPKKPVMQRFIRFLKTTHPGCVVVAERRTVIEDFATLVHAENMIGSFSTFSTMAAFLRDDSKGVTLQPQDATYISTEMLTGHPATIVQFEPPIQPFCHSTRGGTSFFNQKPRPVQQSKQRVGKARSKMVNW